MQQEAARRRQQREAEGEAEEAEAALKRVTRLAQEAAEEGVRAARARVLLGTARSSRWRSATSWRAPRRNTA